MIRASLTTKHNHFEAFGQTTSHALNALRRGFAVHAEQYLLPVDWWQAHAGDIVTEYFKLNQAYRNNEPLRKGRE